jgi:hypothetical protein
MTPGCLSYKFQSGSVEPGTTSSHQCGWSESGELAKESNQHRTLYVIDGLQMLNTLSINGSGPGSPDMRHGLNENSQEWLGEKLRHHPPRPPFSELSFGWSDWHSKNWLCQRPNLTNCEAESYLSRAVYNRRCEATKIILQFPNIIKSKMCHRDET